MSEEKKEGSCCTSHGGGGCSCIKLMIGLLIGAFIFAAGMCFGKMQCHPYGNYCPFSSAPHATK